ncbi:MAG: hypothetical protein JXR58_03865, partial [Bacteroidales bacterium]|nr:hypothetical protein [Bacteroidales bacterium]
NYKYFGLYYDGGLIHYSRNEKYNLEFILGFGRGDIEFDKTSYSMFVPFVRRFVHSEYFKIYGQIGAYEIKKSAKKPNRKSSSCLLLRTNYCHFINNFALEEYSADRGSGYTFDVTDTLFFSKMQNTGFFIVEPGFVYTTGGRFLEMKLQIGYSTTLNFSLPPRDMKYNLFKYKHFNFCFGIAFKIKGKEKKTPLELN